MFLSFFRVQISLAIFGSSGMAFQGRSDSDRSHEVPLRVLMLGHSFVAGFKQFLFEDPTRHGPTLNLSTNEFMIQFSGRRGATIPRIRSDLEIVKDFQPHVCVVQAGTNDIGSKPESLQDSEWEEFIAGNLHALAEHLIGSYRVERVVVLQILHRRQPLRPVKYPVNIKWFNARCDNINKLMGGLYEGHERIRFWKHKGLYEDEQLFEALRDDGTHLNSAVGYPKYFKNIRAAIVSMKKELL